QRLINAYDPTIRHLIQGFFYGEYSQNNLQWSACYIYFHASMSEKFGAGCPVGIDTTVTTASVVANCCPAMPVAAMGASSASELMTFVEYGHITGIERIFPDFGFSS
ncbi:unnamed protein product, partial [Amoebophrya sp. A120]